MAKTSKLSWAGIGLIVVCLPLIGWAQEAGGPATGTEAGAAVTVASRPVPRLPESVELVIPVAKVQPASLRDSFAAARSGGRAHNAIDIMAPAETPVLAAVAGEIVSLVNNRLGGITIYQLSLDRKVVFYYAHLARYAEGLEVGTLVRQGETIAYVGDTGNAGKGNYHLHFAIWLIEDAKRYWSGENVNPYPILKELPVSYEEGQMPAERARERETERTRGTPREPRENKDGTSN